jgi:uncharacterized membrane protein YeaQ/YmgE (transglycosylase-associated protein family)
VVRTLRELTLAAGVRPTQHSEDRGQVVSILAWIVVGIIAGWLAERITGRNHGLLTNLVVGIVGAFLGGFVFSSLLGFRYEEGFNLASIVVATVGAIILLAIFGSTRTRSTWP